MKKTLRPNQIITIILTAILFVSFLAGMGSPCWGKTTTYYTQPVGSAAIIADLDCNIEYYGSWDSSLQTIYAGIALGTTTVRQLQETVDAINVSSTADAESVFYWYVQLNKLGVSINETTVKTALDAVTMLPNVGGLPYNQDSSVESFSLYNRYDLYAYQWAAQLGYQTSKWNLSSAYKVFNNSVAACGKPILLVGCDQVGRGISYGPRYYDEAAETIDMYLTFWLLGIPDGLTQARHWWNWTNTNLWDTTDDPNGAFYKYALDWAAFECAAGSMAQVVWELYNCDPSIPNVNNIFYDMETRALCKGWSSPQWRDYAVEHAEGLNGQSENSQERLENTISLWGAMMGLYGNMDSTMKSQVLELLNGTTRTPPAWSLIMDSKLYDNDLGLFRAHSDSEYTVEATANGAVLMMMLSTVPLTGSLAVPVQDCAYQDINNVIDGGVSNINLTSRVVTVSVSVPGSFLSMFGTNIFEYTLGSAGVWQLTFSSDWNSITSQTLVSELPSSRIYFWKAGLTVGPTSNPVTTPTPTALTDSVSSVSAARSSTENSALPTDMAGTPTSTSTLRLTQMPYLFPARNNYVLIIAIALTLFLVISATVSAHLRKKPEKTKP